MAATWRNAMRRLASVFFLLLLGAVPTPLSAADVSGRWTGQIVIGMDAKTIPFTLDLKLDGSALAGTICFRDCTGNKQPIQNAKLGGDVISFEILTDTSDVTRFDFRGTVSGDTIKFVINGTGPACGSDPCRVGEASATRAK
jgi:hypothetical protein